MMVTTEVVDVPHLTRGADAVVRCAVSRPSSSAPGSFPVLLCYADIFGHSPAHLRVMQRFAGHGYVVVSPEPWSYFHPAGTVFDFDADRQPALDAQARADVVGEDAARAAVVAFIKGGGLGKGVDVDSRFALGFCFGGHCAFRAALDEGTKATACFYGTGIHNDTLGGGAARSLDEAEKLKGELLLVWGRLDPHVPPAGRALIHRRLDDAGVRFETRLYDAEHAFARDVGPRFDPAATDDAFAATLALFGRCR